MGSDGLSMILKTDVDYTDVTICYDIRNITALMAIVEDEQNKDFNMNLTWMPENERGMIYTHSSDDTEKYFLFSRDI